VVFELDRQNEWEVYDAYRWVWPQGSDSLKDQQHRGRPGSPRNEQITNILYQNGCGLVVTSFAGYIEIYDSVHLNHSVWNNRLSQQKQLRECGSISAIDFSPEQDLLAFGGVSGQIHFID
jgi:hypothetical protein